MSESYTMDDYIKENIIDKYNLRKTDYGYQIGIFPIEYGNLLSKQDKNIWYVATDANILYFNNTTYSIIYAGYTTFNSNALVIKIIDSVNEKLKALKELKIEIKKKEIEKDFEDETL